MLTDYALRHPFFVIATIHLNLESEFDELEKLCRTGENDAIVRKLKNIVSGYSTHGDSKAR